jgi:hypothetical protein
VRVTVQRIACLMCEVWFVMFNTCVTRLI